MVFSPELKVIALGKDAYDLEGGGESASPAFCHQGKSDLCAGSLWPGLTSLSGQPLMLLGPFPMPSPGPAVSLWPSVCQAWLLLLPAL